MRCSVPVGKRGPVKSRIDHLTQVIHILLQVIGRTYVQHTHDSFPGFVLLYQKFLCTSTLPCCRIYNVVVVEVVVVVIIVVLVSLRSASAGAALTPPTVYVPIIGERIAIGITLLLYLGSLILDTLFLFVYVYMYGQYFHHCWINQVRLHILSCSSRSAENRDKFLFSCPRSRLRVWSRKSSSLGVPRQSAQSPSSG